MMNLSEILILFGQVALKMAVIWGSCGIGAIALGYLLKELAGEEIEQFLRYIFNR